MRDLFSFRLTELAYRRAGLKQPADVRLKAEGWFLWLLGVIGLAFVVWGSTVYLTPRGQKRFKSWNQTYNAAWLVVLQSIRLFERGQRVKGVLSVLRGASLS